MRIIKSGLDGVIFLRSQCQRLIPIILGLFKSELSIKNMDNVLEIIRIEESLPECRRRKVQELYSGSIHFLIEHAKGHEKYQYGSLYLTCDEKAAERYADFSYCGGELCDLVYRSVIDMNELWPGKLSLDTEMQKAFDTMHNMAIGDKRSIVYKLPEVKCEYLLTETGGPLSEIFGDSLFGKSFRYIGPVNFDEMEIHWEKINR